MAVYQTYLKISLIDIENELLDGLLADGIDRPMQGLNSKEHIVPTIGYFKTGQKPHKLSQSMKLIPMSIKISHAVTCETDFLIAVNNHRISWQ